MTTLPCGPEVSVASTSMGELGANVDERSGILETRAGVRVVVLGLAAAVLFGAGLVPGYLFEMNGGLSNPAERCPEAIPSEEGYDGRCVDEIVARGPLYLGKELLAASFLAGVSALSGVFLVGRRALTRSARR